MADEHPAEPFATYDVPERDDDELVEMHPLLNLYPAELQQLIREEQRERARRERELAERAAFFEDRRIERRLRRMEYLSQRGIAFNPADESTLREPADEFAARAFAEDDRAVARAHRRAVRKALRDAGLDDVPSFVWSGDAGPVPETAGSPAPAPAARSRFPKVTELLHRVDYGPGHMCPDCVSVRAERAARRNKQ